MCLCTNVSSVFWNLGQRVLTVSECLWKCGRYDNYFQGSICALDIFNSKKERKQKTHKTKTRQKNKKHLEKEDTSKSMTYDLG